MRIFVSSLNVPIGYTTPRFPSLYLPLGHHKPQYESLFLYYTSDIWKYTVYWSLILVGAFFLVSGTVAAFNHFVSNHRYSFKTQRSYSIIESLMIVLFYFVIGLSQGFISGAIIGLIILAIYKAGSLSMSTWIPFCWGAAQILYHIASSYLTSLVIL
ncbi:uncharacterized protein PRCAT00005389001 [Priceomyces carsonii]|uniref:uncharacterized protein n=1 Tax=Priceomyces carsonii TaxID=28549 RepID=UPI002ED9CE8D|nr:unnamed protein product [Priceomyces carsonii]